MSKLETGFAGQTLGTKVLYSVVRNLVCGFTQRQQWPVARRLLST